MSDPDPKPDLKVELTEDDLKHVCLVKGFGSAGREGRPQDVALHLTAHVSGGDRFGRLLRSRADIEGAGLTEGDLVFIHPTGGLFTVTKNKRGYFRSDQRI